MEIMTLKREIFMSKKGRNNPDMYRFSFFLLNIPIYCIQTASCNWLVLGVVRSTHADFSVASTVGAASNSVTICTDKNKIKRILVS